MDKSRLDPAVDTNVRSWMRRSDELGKFQRCSTPDVSQFLVSYRDTAKNVPSHKFWVMGDHASLTWLGVAAKRYLSEATQARSLNSDSFQLQGQLTSHHSHFAVGHSHRGSNLVFVP